MAAKRTYPTLPKSGDAFLMPLEDGRFGVCRVLRENTAEERKGHGCPQILVAASPWIGTAPPDLNDPILREIHHLNHHSWNDPNLLWVSDPPPESFQHIGTIKPTPGDKRRKCYGSGGWFFAGQLEMQWRWDHDREAVLREDREYEEQQAREYEEAEKRRREHLDKLTLASLRKKRRFTDWKDFVPARAATACRALFRETVDAIINLGAKPKKRDIRAILKQCVQRLNKLDAEYDHFIETTAVEDLCGEIDEIAHVSGLGEEYVADRWRDW
jgi:hypothetical protein